MSYRSKECTAPAGSCFRVHGTLQPQSVSEDKPGRREARTCMIPSPCPLVRRSSHRCSYCLESSCWISHVVWNICTRYTLFMETIESYVTLPGRNLVTFTSIQTNIPVDASGRVRIAGLGVASFLQPLHWGWTSTGSSTVPPLDSFPSKSRLTNTVATMKGDTCVRCSGLGGESGTRCPMDELLNGARPFLRFC